MRTNLKQAITHIILKHPFLATLALHLRWQEADIPTFATDGETVYYSPQFIETLNVNEIAAVIAHEVLHCALGHLWRRGSREPILWNIAIDFAVNLIVGKMSGMSLPKSALLDYNFYGMSAEEIYAKLRSTPSKYKKLNTLDQHRYPSSPQKVKEMENKWERITVTALHEGLRRGNLPNNIERLFDYLLKSKTDWRALLRQFIQNIVAKTDYRWLPPGKKQLWRAAFNDYFYSPTFSYPSLGTIAIAVDTSGSISHDTLSHFFAEIKAIRNTYPCNVIVITCDAEIQNEYFIHEFEPLPNFKLKGGGGTDFRPVFNRLKNEPIQVLIYLTDGDGFYPDKPPHYPVLWALSNNYEVPFGYKIILDLEVSE